MLFDIKKRELFREPQDLFDFARSYLSEDFPNPERAGCPQESALRSFARNPREGDPSIANHVACCSPCFSAYAAQLKHARVEAEASRELKRAARFRWSLVPAALGTGLLIVLLTLLMKTQNKPNVTHNSPASTRELNGSAQGPLVASSPVLVDLTMAAPERGHQPPSQAPMRSIPARPRIDLMLHLPIGSEAGMYSVSLTSTRGTEWSSAARASIENGEPVLNLRADFSHLLDGTYELVVASKGQRLRQGIVITRPPDPQR